MYYQVDFLYEGELIAVEMKNYTHPNDPVMLVLIAEAISYALKNHGIKNIDYEKITSITMYQTEDLNQDWVYICQYDTKSVYNLSEE